MKNSTSILLLHHSRRGGDRKYYFDRFESLEKVKGKFGGGYNAKHHFIGGRIGSFVHIRKGIHYLNSFSPIFIGRVSQDSEKAWLTGLFTIHPLIIMPFGPMIWFYPWAIGIVVAIQAVSLSANHQTIAAMRDFILTSLD